MRAGQSVAAVLRGETGRAAPSGHAPSKRKSSNSPRTQTQNPRRLRSARSAGARGIRRRRQRAKRSTAAARNGSRHAISTSSIAQPRISREPR